jgi:5'(3')-deoxyribonucleotidase
MKTEFNTSSSLDLDESTELIDLLRDYVDYQNKADEVEQQVQDQFGFKIQGQTKQVDGEEVRVLQLNE